jgi:hypothetical protein
MCEYLTNDTKVRLLNTTERDDQGSKVTSFFEGVDDMFDEMAKETTRTAIPLLGQLAHVHLESNPQLGRHYQLDCRLLHSTLMDPLLILELISQVCV